MGMCYHILIYAEFEIINMVFLKKDAQNISRRTLSIRQIFYIFHVYTEISVWSWTFGLKSWKSHGKVMEIHWSECVRTLKHTHTHMYSQTCSATGAQRFC